MNEDTRRDRDTATLREILQAAKDLNSICVAGPGRIGGMVKYLGETCNRWGKVHLKGILL